MKSRLRWKTFILTRHVDLDNFYNKLMLLVSSFVRRPEETKMKNILHFMFLKEEQGRSRFDFLPEFYKYFTESFARFLFTPFIFQCGEKIWFNFSAGALVSQFHDIFVTLTLRHFCDTEMVVYSFTVLLWLWHFHNKNR